MEFGRAAIEESRNLCPAGELQVHSVKRSLVLPAGGWTLQVIWSWVDLGLLLSSIMLILSGALIGVADSTASYGLIAVCVGLGMVFMFCRGGLRSIVVRWKIGGRRNLLFDPGRDEVCFVEIEDLATIDKLKVVAEDQGICCFDSTQRRILIEGFVNRYVIHSAEVTRLDPKSGTDGVILECRIGDATLGLVIKGAGGPQSLYERTCRTLGYEAPPR